MGKHIYFEELKALVHIDQIMIIKPFDRGGKDAIWKSECLVKDDGWYGTSVEFEKLVNEITYQKG